ncbi:MAG: pentapeptide repeat-containing protein [Acidimicrobiia bacterium]|nr:pentapeptide repeat-containing protein [Acidimicrobiia bacterium]
MIKRPWARSFAAIGVLAVLAWWKWDWLVSAWPWLGYKNGGETNSTTLRNLLLVLLALIGIILTIWRINVAERTLSHSEKRDRTDRHHSRYADASARLSSESVSARMGAVYELQALTAQDPELLHIRTMKLLCVLVRYPPPEARLDESPDDDPCSGSLRPDVQAAMEVIGSRTAECIKLEDDAGYMPDLRRANLVRLELREGNLSRIDMRGSVFWGADLMRADLSGSELQYADFSSPWVVRGEEPPTIATTQGTWIETLNAQALSTTRLAGANFSGSRMLLAKFAGVDLQGAAMSDANLPNTRFDSATLYGVDFSNSELLEADLSNTSLTSVTLTGANLHRTNLTSTDLSGFFSKGATETFPPTGLTQAQLDQSMRSRGQATQARREQRPELEPSAMSDLSIRRIVVGESSRGDGEDSSVATPQSRV